MPPVTKNYGGIKGMVNCQNSQHKGPRMQVPVGRPPYTIIILNIRFIPETSLGQVLKSQQVYIYLSDI